MTLAGWSAATVGSGTVGVSPAHGTVGPVGVDVCFILAEDGSGVRGVEDQESVEHFTADGAHEPLGDGVRARRPDRDPDHHCSGAGDDGVAH
jgi:hypothetical protein